MSSQFARLKHALNRASTTSVGPVQVAVFADDLHSILAHYITVSTELAELKAAPLQQDLSDQLCEQNESLGIRCAELETQNKTLVELLKTALEYFRQHQQRYKNREPVWVEDARAAIAAIEGEKK